MRAGAPRQLPPFSATAQPGYRTARSSPLAAPQAAGAHIKHERSNCRTTLLQICSCGWLSMVALASHASLRKAGGGGAAVLRCCAPRSLALQY